MIVPEIARLKEIASNACNEKWGIAGPSFLRAFDPTTVLSLLAALEQAQDALAEAEATAKELEGSVAICRQVAVDRADTILALRARLETANALLSECAERLGTHGHPRLGRRARAAIAEMEKEPGAGDDK